MISVWSELMNLLYAMSAHTSVHTAKFRREETLSQITLDELKAEMNNPVAFIATLLPGWKHGPDPT